MPRTGQCPGVLRNRLSAVGLVALALCAGGATHARADVSGPEIVGYINAQRAAHGVPAGIVHDAALSSGCAKHNAYGRLNNVLSHTENASAPGYTPEGLYAAERSVLYQGDTWTAARNPFEDAPAHLHLLLAPRLDRMGASENAGWGCANVLASLNRPVAVSDTSYSYPAAGTAGWPLAQVAMENGPLVGIPLGTQTGPYLYVMFDGPGVTPYDKATATSATLTAASGPVSVAVLHNTTPGVATGSMPPGMQVIPRAPLSPGTTYTASVAASVTTGNGAGAARGFSRTWSFTTEAQPDTTITSGPSGLTRSRSASLSFTSSKTGVNFECRLDAGPQWELCSSPWSLSDLADGSHTWSVRASDLSGIDPTPASRTWSVDATAPATVTLSAIVPSSPANANTPVVKGVAEAGSTVRLYSGAACTTLLAIGLAAEFASPGFAITVADDSSTLLRAVANDPAGNTSPCPAGATTYVEDSTAPAPPAPSDFDPDSPANTNAPAAKGAAETGSTVRLYAGGSCGGAIVASGSAAEFASPGLAVAVADDSTTTLRATATDAAANTSACSPASIVYVEDSIAPGAPSFGAVAPTSPTNANAPKVSGTAAAGSTVRLYAGGACAGAALATGPAADFATPGLAVAVADDSTTTLRATATDSAGNASPCSAGSITYVEDSTAPPAVTLGVAPASPANANTLTATGTAESGSTVRVYLGGSCTGTPAATESAAALLSPGVALAVADDSTTTLRATVTDTAGNTSPCSPTSTTFVEDSTAPAPATLTLTDPASPANANTPRVRGTAEAGSTVRLFAGAACTGAGAAAGTAAEFASPGIAVVVADGSSTTLRATVMDAAGNASACSTSSITYVEDSTLPPPTPPPDPTPTPTPTPFTPLLLPPTLAPPPPPPPPLKASTRARFVGPVMIRLVGRAPTRIGSRLKIKADVREEVGLLYRWRRNGRSIARATQSTYRLQRADRGKRITCRLTAVGRDGVAVSRSSATRRIPRR